MSRLYNHSKHYLTKEVSQMCKIFEIAPLSLNETIQQLANECRCVSCGKKCNYIGEINKYGERKAQCCGCYYRERNFVGHRHPNFSKNDFCSICQHRRGNKLK